MDRTLLLIVLLAMIHGLMRVTWPSDVPNVVGVLEMCVKEISRAKKPGDPASGGTAKEAAPNSAPPVQQPGEE